MGNQFSTLLEVPNWHFNLKSQIAISSSMLELKPGFDRILSMTKDIDTPHPLIPSERIASCIFLIRGHKVLFDRHLADLYGVQVKNLNRAVKRNVGRFPEDFMFQLTSAEWSSLKCQFGTSNRGGDRRALPYVFTEQGVAMLSGILNSKSAIQVNIAIMRAFVRLRNILSHDKELAVKFGKLERRVALHDKHFQNVFEALNHLMEPPEKPRPQIGFKP